MHNITDIKTNFMSEMNTVTVPVSEFTSLKEQVNSLNREVGAKEQLIQNLKDNQKVIREKVSNDYSGSKVVSRETLGLEEVTDTLRKELKGSFEKEISKLEKTVESLTSSNKGLTTINKEQSEDYSENLNKIQRDTNKRIVELKDDYREQLEKKAEKINALLEEIQKIKDSKTDKEVEEARNKEILDLKTRISLLEDELSVYSNMSFFKRIFTVRKANAADKEVAKEKARLEYVTNRTGVTYVSEDGNLYKNNREGRNKRDRKREETAYWSFSNTASQIADWVTFW